jgi:5-methylcytosine-specific restriction enzyme A
MRWAAVRKTVLDRDENKCRRCRLPATDVHHRRLKGRGGTRDEETAFGLANLVALCRECHHHVHMNVAESYRQGWIVHSWHDPAQIPIAGAEECAPIF